jgi:peptidoglycan/LPS O-acetylase OafA/YrhL
MGERAQSVTRVRGLDSIRFICAITIVVFHFGIVPQKVFGDDPHGLVVVVRGILGSLFNGPAALIVFFVISGFGIHFAFRNDLTVDVRSFYSRRLIRISGPALIALAIWTLLGIKFEPQGPGPFWTVTCEAEYYLLYPVLLSLRRQFGWWPLILVGQIFAYGLALSHLPDIEKLAGGYPAFEWWNWVMGLPCWLTGCWLAESFNRFPQPSASMIWLARAGIFWVSVVLNFLRFHGGSVYLTAPFTLNLFAVLACLWLGLEIAYRKKKPAPRILEWAGNWTYSIYLVHPTIPRVLPMIAWVHPVFTSSGISFIALSGSLVLAYTFHLAIEAPFYRLAIRVGRRLQTKRPEAAQVIDAA